MATDVQPSIVCSNIFVGVLLRAVDRKLALGQKSNKHRKEIEASLSSLYFR